MSDLIDQRDIRGESLPDHVVHLPHFGGHRVCGGRIMGFEYFAPEFTDIPYRGNTNLLWKADYAKLYRENCPGLTVEREQLFPCLDEPGNTDKLFLLKKI